MILDASVVIALRSPQDAHAGRARAVVLRADQLLIHPVTMAEVLVVPARAGLAAQVRSRLVEGLGLRVWATVDDEPLHIAELRASTRVALPDCYPLWLAEHTGLPLATFDDRLTRAARDRGLLVVG